MFNGRETRSMVDGRYAQITSGNSLKGLLGAILKL